MVLPIAGEKCLVCLAKSLHKMHDLGPVATALGVVASFAKIRVEIYCGHWKCSTVI